MTVTASGSVPLSWEPILCSPGIYASAYDIYVSTNQSTFAALQLGFTPTTTPPALVTFTDTAAVAGQTYTYQYLPYCGPGVVPSGAPVPAMPGEIPLAPQNLTAIVTGANQVSLSWVPVINAVFYNVYRSSSSSGPWTIVSQNLIGVSGVSTYVDSPNAGTWYYVVQAVNFSGDVSSPSAPASVNLTVTAPSGPVTAATCNGSNCALGSITVSWPPVGGATSYMVLRGICPNDGLASAGPPQTCPFGEVGTVAQPTVTLLDSTDLQLNTTYYYVIRAIDASGNPSSDSPVSKDRKSVV